ncbi:MAG: hypothetical protein M3Q99_00445 [Acidobacteriota bacterium]|nr:hypothetical protein [Acidobacteriota bacterium]
MLAIRIIAGIFFGIWLLLLLLGKSGFIHLLLLSGIGFGAVDLACLYRGRTTVK